MSQLNFPISAPRAGAICAAAGNVTDRDLEARCVAGPIDPASASVHKRVLVVDDDAGARLVLGELLCGAGFTVETAESGASALKKVHEHPPDIIFTDLHMPGMDGIELCSALQALDADLPVVILTAFEDVPSAVKGLRAGAVDYLMKPVEFEAVLLSVQRAFERRAAKVEREQLRARNDELCEQATSALRAYEDLLSIVCHDLRNPLSVICLQAQRLATVDMPRHPEVDQRGPDLRDMAASILRNATCMERLIADLLDTSRLQNGHLSLDCAAHSLAHLLDDVSELRPLALSKQIDLQVRRRTERLLSCDRGRLGQVLANLVGNAIKFSPKSSSIHVFAEDAEGGVQFAVRDDGPGIPRDAIPRIFDRFWQSKEGGLSGAGLGLYIAKGIVERHGGRLWVESQPGVGSTFYAFVPDAPMPVRQSIEASTA